MMTPLPMVVMRVVKLEPFLVEAEVAVRVDLVVRF